MPGERRELTFSATCRGARIFVFFYETKEDFSRRDRSALEGWAGKQRILHFRDFRSAN